MPPPGPPGMSNRRRYQPPRPDVYTFATQEKFFESLHPVSIESVPEKNRKCAHCWKCYGESDPGLDNAELPVKFRCGHVFGEKCMKHLFALPEVVRFDFEKLSFGPGSRGAALGAVLHAYLVKYKGKNEIADKAAAFALFLDDISKDPGRTGLDSDWKIRLLNALSPRMNVVDIHILENALIFDLVVSDATTSDPFSQYPHHLIPFMTSPDGWYPEMDFTELAAASYSDTSSNATETPPNMPAPHAPTKHIQKGETSDSLSQVSNPDSEKSVHSAETSYAEIMKQLHDPSIAPHLPNSLPAEYGILYGAGGFAHLASSSDFPHHSMVCQKVSAHPAFKMMQGFSGEALSFEDIDTSDLDTEDAWEEDHFPAKSKNSKQKLAMLDDMPSDFGDESGKWEQKISEKKKETESKKKAKAPAGKVGGKQKTAAVVKVKDSKKKAKIAEASTDIHAKLKAAQKLLKSTLERKAAQEAHMKAAQIRAAKAKAAREALVKKTTAILVHSLTDLYETYEMHYGRPPPAKKLKKTPISAIGAAAEMEAMDSMDAYFSKAQDSLLMAAVNVNALTVHAKHYDIGQPTSSHYAGSFPEDEEDSLDDGEEGGESPNAGVEHVKEGPPKKTVLLVRKIGMDSKSQESRATAYPVPDYITWRDAKKVPDGCPICQSVLFLKPGARPHFLAT